MKWNAVLDGSDQVAVETAIDEITDELAATFAGSYRHTDAWLHDPVAGVSLGAGLPGVVVFFAERYRLLGDQAAGSVAVELLELSLQRARAIVLPTGFYRGLAGLAWVHSLLVRYGLLEDSAKVAPRGLSRSALESNTSADQFDLISGLAGIGIYLSSLAEAESSLALLTQKLMNSSTLEVGNRRWITSPEYLSAAFRRSYPKGYCDTGLAHGQSGVIASFAAINARTSYPIPLCVPIEQAFEWLNANKLPPGSRGQYPRRIAIHTGIPELCGIGWCNGDLSIMIALIRAGLSFQRQAWFRQGLDLAINCARIPARRSGAVDPGLCHGTAGIGHTFNRLYQLNRHPAFRTTSRDWLLRTLEFREPGTPLAGFMRLYSERYGKASATPHRYGFLNGISGIGLALLGSLTDSSPAWDEALCLDFPDASAGVSPGL